MHTHGHTDGQSRDFMPSFREHDYNLFCHSHQKETSGVISLFYKEMFTLITINYATNGHNEIYDNCMSVLCDLRNATQADARYAIKPIREFANSIKVAYCT